MMSPDDDDDDDVEQVELCPICFAYLPITELQEHVQLHLIEDEASTEQKQDVEDDGIVHCRECGTSVPLADWDSHCTAHRLSTIADHDNAAAAAELEEQQQLDRLQEHYFAAMQAQQGFSTLRPGKCFACGQEGHWRMDCPAYPPNERLRRPTIRLEADAIIDAQYPDAQQHSTSDAQHKGNAQQQQRNMQQDANVQQQPSAQQHPSALDNANAQKPSAQQQQNAGQSADGQSGTAGNNTSETITSHSTPHSKPHSALHSTLHSTPGLLPLLAKRLSAQQGGRVSVYMAGQTSMFASARQEDAGWGCGYRNLQMLSSFLLHAHPEARNVLYGGCGYVPAIHFLQAWIELAWSTGFDQAGAEQLQHQLQNTRKWIGTTEAAVVLRFFGCRAHIVDIDGGQVLTNEHRVQQAHDALVNWVWNYFVQADGGLPHTLTRPSTWKEPGGVEVQLTGKCPLYWQHEGHSCTIIGIERRIVGTGVQQRTETKLLVLDPSHTRAQLTAALESGRDWARLIKRGVHTLKHPQYQLLYVGAGLADEEERQRGRVIAATERLAF